MVEVMAEEVTKEMEETRIRIEVYRALVGKKIIENNVLLSVSMNRFFFTFKSLSVLFFIIFVGTVLWT